ncbi:MAG: addiction module protein [Rhodoferax sp.]|nr:addiction module protein [Rhodoferax sp.]
MNTLSQIQSEVAALPVNLQGEVLDFVQFVKQRRVNLSAMSQISVADILELPVQERIQLVEVIWESIAAFPDAMQVSPALKTELGARLADFERNPEAGYSWDQVKAHVRSGSWRTA